MACINVYVDELCWLADNGIRNTFPKVWYTTPSLSYYIYSQLAAAGKELQVYLQAIRSSSFFALFFFFLDNNHCEMRQYPLYASILKTFFSQHTENTKEKKLLKQFSFLKNQQPPRQNVRMFFFSDSSLFLRVLLSFLVICHPFWLFFWDGIPFIFFFSLREAWDLSRSPI